MILDRKKYEAGFIKMIIVIIAILIVLGYFNFNLRQIVGMPTVQDNLLYVKEVVIYVWETFLRAPVTFVWNLVVSGWTWK